MIDARFIRDVEGFSTKGYIPREEEGDNNVVKAGVTVGIGVDLGYLKVNRISIPDELREKLLPYAGKKGKAAKKALREKPLFLTEEEAMMLSQLQLLRYNTFVKNYWNADSQVKWSALPDAFQTVVFSVLYQYGRPERVPRFWLFATTLDIKRMIEELRDFGDSYPTRRNKEADYLEEHIGEDYHA